VQVVATCDRVNLIQDGTIAFDKPRSSSSSTGEHAKDERPSAALI
jgi:hypothetical protein